MTGAAFAGMRVALNLFAYPVAFADIPETEQEKYQSVNVLRSPAESHVQAQVHDDDINIDHIDTQGGQFEQEGSPCVARSRYRLEEDVSQCGDERRCAEHPQRRSPTSR